MRILTGLTALILALAPLSLIAKNKKGQRGQSVVTQATDAKCQADLKSGSAGVQTGPNGLPLFNENSKLFTAQPVTTHFGKDKLLLGQIVQRVKLGTAESPRPDRWKMVFYNVENLFMRVGRFERTGGNGFQKVEDVHPDEKTADEIEWQRKLLAQTQFNQAVLIEVAASDDLKEFFNDPRFKLPYQDFVHNGNDTRGINVGMMVQKHVRFEAIYVTYKYVQWNDPADGDVLPIFPRDLPVMFLRDLATGEIVLVVVGRHGKSKRDRPGDKESNLWRDGEQAAADQIIEQLLAEFGADTRIITGGDYNTDTRKNNSKVLDHLKRFTRSVFDLVANPLPYDQRITQTFHPRDGEAVMQQLDDAFVTKGLWNRILGSRIIRYMTGLQDPNGRVMPYARSFDERAKQPSDHMAFEVDVDISTGAKK